MYCDRTRRRRSMSLFKHRIYPKAASHFSVRCSSALTHSHGSCAIALSRASKSGLPAFGKKTLRKQRNRSRHSFACLALLFVHRFYQTPAIASVWIDALSRVSKSGLPDFGNSARTKESKQPFVGQPRNVCFVARSAATNIRPCLKSEVSATQLRFPGGYGACGKYSRRLRYAPRSCNC